MLAFWSEVNEFVRLNQGLIQLAVTVLTALVAVATWMAARAARKSASATRRASEGDLFSDLIDEYTNEASVDHIRRIVRWRKTHEPDFQNIWLSALRDGSHPLNDEAEKVERSRRVLHAFFSKVIELLETGFLSEKLFNRLVLGRMAEVFVKGVAPLSQALNPERGDRWLFETYAKRFKIDPVKPFGWASDPTTQPKP